MGKQKTTIRNKRKIGISKYQNNVIDTKEAHKQISRSFSRELKLTIVSIFIVTIVMISSAFAIFSSIQKSEKYNTLTIGTLKVDFTDTDEDMGNIINLNGAYPESDTEGLKEEPYSFKITNSGTLDARYKIKILDDTDMIAEDGCQENLLAKDKIRLSINGEEPFTLSDTMASEYEVSTGVLKASESANYNIRIWIDEQAGNKVLGSHYHGKIVVESVNSKAKNTNKNIVAAYTYNDTTCITGGETTCVETTCYEDSSANSCGSGTIIKYAVNDTEDKIFYVLHDDGENMTLQQRENTLRNIEWYSTSNDNSQGPITILPQLESATAGWTNVNDQTYTMGTTNFNNTNGFTGCSSINSCTTNTYTLAERTGKARMITLQEAASTGCTTTSKSCPKWMYNYLYQSTSYGGSVDDNSQTTNYNWGYWTMSAYSSHSNNAWIVNRFGYAGSDNTTYTSSGARAVVVISK